MRVCGGSGEGGGRGCPAVSRAAAAAAAGRSPREKEGRARPGDGSAGRGGRRRSLHSHRELRAAAAGRHTPARPARLSVGAAGCTALRRPGLPHGAPLRSKLLWRPVGNCGRRAPGGWGLRAGVLVCAFTGQPPGIAEESEVWRVRGGARRRVGIRSHKPSPAGVPERVKRQRSWRGAVWLRKPQKKKFGSPCLPAGPRRSRTAAAAAGDSTAGAGLGDFSRVLFPAGCGCTEVNGEQRLPASQPGGAGMTKPAGRRQPRSSAAEREGKQSLSRGSLQLLDGLMSASDRLLGAGMSPRTQRQEPRVRSQKSLGDSDGFGPKPSNL